MSHALAQCVAGRGAACPRPLQLFSVELCSDSASVGCRKGVTNCLVGLDVLRILSNAPCAFSSLYGSVVSYCKGYKMVGLRDMKVGRPVCIGPCAMICDMVCVTLVSKENCGIKIWKAWSERPIFAISQSPFCTPFCGKFHHHIRNP